MNDLEDLACFKVTAPSPIFSGYLEGGNRTREGRVGAFKTAAVETLSSAVLEFAGFRAERKWGREGGRSPIGAVLTPSAALSENIVVVMVSAMAEGTEAHAIVAAMVTGQTHYPGLHSSAGY